MAALNLVDTLRPLHRITKIFGLTPFREIKVHGRYEYMKTHYRMAWCFFIGLLMLGFHINFTVLNRGKLKTGVSPLTEAVDFYYVYSVEMMFPIAILSNWYHQNCVIEALNRLQKVDQSLIEMGGNLRYNYVKSLISFTLTAIIGLFMTMEGMNCNLFIASVTLFNTICYISCVILLIFTFLETFSFIVYALLIRQRFQAVNNILRKSLPAFQYQSIIHNDDIHSTLPKIINIGPVPELLSPSYKKSIILKTRTLHMELCSIARLINRYFSALLCLIIGLHFVGFTTNAYNVFELIMETYSVKSVNKNSIHDFFDQASILWAVLNLLQLWIISAVCNSTKSACFDTGEILFTARDRFDANIAPKLSLFGKQILHCDFKLTALDLFDLDMTLFYGVVGAAATYITILIQFGIAGQIYSNTINNTVTII